MFATSRLFLERLGLNALSDLPALADFVPESSVVEALERGLLLTSVEETVPSSSDASPGGLDDSGEL
jgi:chromosome segregation and condensation protein ScpB